MSVKDKTALITGSASGIGKECAFPPLLMRVYFSGDPTRT
jgi:short-subunit dehydrogenase involved in D-alanine esterification of teichoic acids